MYAVHVGPNPFAGGWNIAFLPLAGHSAALFAVLAGVSVALMSGGRNPKRGNARFKVSVRLVVRAFLLILLGLSLTALNTGYLIILAYYGICFLLILPFLRLRARTLVVIALASTVVLPLASLAIRAVFAPRPLNIAPPDATFGTLFSSGGIPTTLVTLLLTGTFPAFTLMVYIFAGLAIGRLDLTSNKVCRRLLIGGVALVATSSAISWLSLNVWGGMDSIIAGVAPQAAKLGVSPGEYYGQYIFLWHGASPTTNLNFQLLSNGASYTPFDLAISVGAAAAVIGACQLIVAYFPRSLTALADLGGRALSAYILQFIVMMVFWRRGEALSSLFCFLEFSLVALVAAAMWKKWVGRGPFEWLLHTISTWPERIWRKSSLPRPRLPSN
jgi:hypothetical protein